MTIPYRIGSNLSNCLRRLIRLRCLSIIVNQRVVINICIFCPFAAVGIEGDGYIISRPLCGKGYILCRHGELVIGYGDAFRCLPTAEGIALTSGLFRRNRLLRASENTRNRLRQTSYSVCGARYIRDRVLGFLVVRRSIAVFVLCVINLDYSVILNGFGNRCRLCFFKNVSRILIFGVDICLVNSQGVATNPNILLHRLRIVFLSVLVVLNAVRCFLGSVFVLCPLCIEGNIFVCHGESIRIWGSFAICLRIPRSKTIPRLGKRVLLNSYSCTRNISLCIGDCIAASAAIAVIGHAVSRNCNCRRFGQLGFAILAICQTCILCIICSCNIGRIIMRTALPRCACRICCDIEFQLQLITLPVTILINNQITLVRIVKSGNFNGLSL